MEIDHHETGTSLKQELDQSISTILNEVTAIRQQQQQLIYFIISIILLLILYIHGSLVNYRNLQSDVSGHEYMDILTSKHNTTAKFDTTYNSNAIPTHIPRRDKKSQSPDSLGVDEKFQTQIHQQLRYFLSILFSLC